MEKAPEESMESPSMMTYVVGAVLVIAVIAGAWYFRSKGAKNALVEPTGQPIAAATPTPGPITKLGCDQQYFNPKIGFSEYYLTAEGGDVSDAKEITCQFSVTIDGKEVAKATIKSPLTASPQRGGSTFRCTTKPVEIAPNVPAIVDVVITDDLKASSSCSAAFTFPQP
ncbi:MAG: hypothetical protein AAB542_02930 [Patescibacteria group bacterium]